MQSRNPVFADFADLMTDAFGAAQAAGEEARGVFRARALRMAREMDLATRDELDAARAEVAALREQVESLTAEIAALKDAKPAKAAPKRRSTRKSTGEKASD